MKGEQMKIIAIMNQKGGIGKTMTAASVAYLMGQECEKRVLAVDADQQGNLSMIFGAYEPEGAGMSELLERHITTGGKYRTSDLIHATKYSGVDIIPANGYLMRTNMRLLLQEREDQVTRFSAAMMEVQSTYDYVVVDCGLLMDMTVTNVLVAADIVIMPVKVGGFEIAAAENMEEQLEDMRGLNPGIRAMALMTMLQRNKTSLQVAEWMQKQSGHDVFKHTVRRSIVAEKATMQRVPLPAFSPRCALTQDYRGVVREIMEEMEG